MKAGGSMPKKPRKKAKKKPVVKQQGLKRKIKKSLRAELLDGINSGELNMSNLTPEQLAIAFGPKRATEILAAAAGAQDFIMTNQQTQDQGQIATGGSAVATGGSANASAEANPNIDVDAEAKAKAIFESMNKPTLRDDMMPRPPAQRGDIIMTPEGPMIIDPITGVLMPLPMPTPGFGILPPGDGMMQGPRMEDGFFDVMPMPIDPATGLPFINQGPGFVPGIEPSLQDNVIRNVESGTLKEGGRVSKKKRKVMKKRKSNRYGR